MGIEGLPPGKSHSPMQALPDAANRSASGHVAVWLLHPHDSRAGPTFCIGMSYTPPPPRHFRSSFTWKVRRQILSLNPLTAEPEALVCGPKPKPPVAGCIVSRGADANVSECSHPLQGAFLAWPAAVVYGNMSVAVS